jgi:hypothetical protein
MAPLKQPSVGSLIGTVEGVAQFVLATQRVLKSAIACSRVAEYPRL